MIVDVLNRIRSGDEDGGEGTAHAALFAHVGVADPEDWRSVALALAERYAPHVLTGEARPAPVRRKAGRPKKWDEMAKGVLLSAIDELQKDSKEGRIRRNLGTTEAACDFLLTDPQAASLRERCRLLGMPVNVSLDNLKNVASLARGEQPDRVVEITET